jgi:serine/threonine protein kinase
VDDTKCVTQIRQGGVITMKNFENTEDNEKLIFGKYRLLSEIGRGGMGIVYKALDVKLEREVAIKQLNLDPRINEESRIIEVRRFTDEARKIAKLNHPNIVSIFEAGEFENENYIVMEYLNGLDLAMRVHNGAQFDLISIINIIIYAAAALGEAHKKNIIHRDVKPGNIMVLDNGTIKVMDFGIAKSLDTNTIMTSPDIVAGTINYMAPERFDSRMVINASTDIFSLCVILYELITKQKPFPAESLYTYIGSLSRFEPYNTPGVIPNSPDSLLVVIYNGLLKDQRLRYQNIDELIVDLNQVLIELNTGVKAIIQRRWEAVVSPSSSPPTPSPDPPPPPPRKKIIIIAALFLTALIIISLFFTYQTSSSTIPDVQNTMITMETEAHSPSISPTPSNSPIPVVTSSTAVHTDWRKAEVKITSVESLKNVKKIKFLYDKESKPKEVAIGHLTDGDKIVGDLKPGKYKVRFIRDKHETVSIDQTFKPGMNNLQVPDSTQWNEAELFDVKLSSNVACNVHLYKAKNGAKDEGSIKDIALKNGAKTVTVKVTRGYKIKANSIGYIDWGPEFLIALKGEVPKKKQITMKELPPPPPTELIDTPTYTPIETYTPPPPPTKIDPGTKY